MYSKIFELHSELLKAMSHPSRLEIIHLLRDQELSVSEIFSMLDLPQPKVSQHLMVLRGAGIVSTQKEGKQIYYCLAHPNFIAASDLIREVLIDTNGDQKLLKELKLPMKELVPLVHDPVCNMRISPKTAGYHLNHNHHTYYFCASGCVTRFKKDPDKYVQT